jgi:ABC-type sugar transport system substrate-binding protein
VSQRATLASVLAVVAVGCGDADRDRSGPVAGVIKGLDNPFFGTMRDGMRAAASEYAAPLRVDAAAGLQDTDGQASALESLAGGHPSCLVVNPINATNLIEPLSHVADGTPVVNIDSPVDRSAARAVGVAITTYIGTDNVAAGRLAAETMARRVPADAQVAVITGIPGDVSSGQRARGFAEGADGRLRVVETAAADFDRDRARLATAELLQKRPALRGLFAVNDEMALGAAAAVRAAGRRGDVAVVGLDGTREALEAVRAGRLSATVAQYPFAIGRLGVEACLAADRGARIPLRIDAPVQAVTRANVERALAEFPQPAEPFNDPLSPLLNERRGT